jgi:hypothetical protein
MGVWHTYCAKSFQIFGQDCNCNFISLVQITGQLAEVATSNLGHLEFTMFLEGQLREDAG